MLVSLEEDSQTAQAVVKFLSRSVLVVPVDLFVQQVSGGPLVGISFFFQILGVAFSMGGEEATLHSAPTRSLALSGGWVKPRHFVLKNQGAALSKKNTAKFPPLLENHRLAA